MPRPSSRLVAPRSPGPAGNGARAAGGGPRRDHRGTGGAAADGHAPPDAGRAPAAGDVLVRGADVTLADQLAGALVERIERHALRPGTRLPSIREAAQRHGISRFTVVEAYDRLVARGLVESRRGAGFFVRERADGGRAPARAASLDGAGPARDTLDVTWLLDSMFRQMPGPDHPGAGLLPAEWLDGELIASAVRAVGRRPGRSLLDYGSPLGYAPLRQQLVVRLDGMGIGASPDGIVTTSGVTHAIDLVARHFVGPGDTVLVEDPAWFVMFGRFAAFGARVVGVPRQADGPDLDVLRRLLARHHPRLFVLSSVTHNPTGTAIGAARAYALLKLAEEHDLVLVDDDIYGDLHLESSARGAMRVAALDQLRRTIHLGGFSKTLAAGLRAGFIACDPALAARLADLKMLTGLTTPELPERVLHQILSGGHYRRHCERVRSRVEAARERTARRAEQLGLRLFPGPGTGLFLWADCGQDTNRLAARCAESGVLVAPGSLFSPRQAPSTWTRLSVACGDAPAVWRVLARALEAGAG
jgi:DNA-binding transcriptional MocR family regulator